MGPVVIDILRGSSNDGHTYLYFHFPAWQSGHGKKVNLSPRFYDRNEKDVLKAVQGFGLDSKNPQAADRLAA
ncbi:MAG: hypothetical protein R3C28_11185 [Pirellulaceae bacterium]